MRTKIPRATIVLLSRILPDLYSHRQIDGLFLTAGAPDNIPSANKQEKVREWLAAANAECEFPLVILGKILEDFMDEEPYGGGGYSDGQDAKRMKTLEAISNSLSKDGLFYSRGGSVRGYDSVLRGELNSIKLLRKKAKEFGFKNIEDEIDRALKSIDTDPLAAVHYAGNVLEATLDSYITTRSLPLQKSSGRSALTARFKQVIDDIGISLKQTPKPHLKQIAVGLNQIVEGTMHIRNKNSAAHGGTEAARKEKLIKDRHARLVINAAHTLSLYVLECLGDKQTEGE